MSQPFEFRGINHLALVCRDMQRTVDFYQGVLGMPLVKTIALPGGMGQHFFFDIGNGDCLAFFWFPNAPEAVPGVSSPAALPGVGDLATAVGSMNHVALAVPADRIEILRRGFDATMKDPAFVADAEKQRLPVSPKSGEACLQAIKDIYALPDAVVAAAKKVLEN